MPRVPLHALIWSRDQGLYELYTRGQFVQRFRSGDHQAWQSWLCQVTSLAFHSPFGSLNVYQEARPRGGAYWYAYHTNRGGTRKHYLGRTAQVSLARLEAAAQALSNANENTLSSTPPSFLHASPEAEQGLMLPSTKLSAPRVPSSLVERKRLQALLDGALSKPLTLLAASAGWGKTTLLSMWASLHPRAVAWLSLDSLDNDPFRFWAAVIAALRTRVPGIGALALAMVRSPQPPPFSALLTALLNDLAEHGAPLLQLLDDYQVIDDPLIQESVTFWVEHLPAHVHLLLSSRVDPDLPLPRWRVRGQLLEIRTDDIRFRPAEASLFLQQTMGLSLSEAEVTALQSRTEGWVAGLQLAALSLRQQEDPSAWIATFRGDHRYVLDYVQQEILRQQPEPVQRFLVQVAVLTRLNVAVCQAVTGEQASQEILETLERSHLFVVPLDSERQWYRLHDLFREALLARLQANQPELVPMLHSRAASFYETVGELREAIAHALIAPDYPFAASLMEQAAPQFWLSGEARTVQNWVLSLPDDVLRAHPRLALNAALYSFNSVHTSTETVYASIARQVERTITRVEQLLHSQPKPAFSAPEMALIERRLRVLHALSEDRAIHKRGDIEGLRHLAASLEMLPPDEEESWNIIPLSITFWLTALLQGEGAQLVPGLRLAKQRMMKAGDNLGTIRVMSRLALASLRAGQLHLAYQECLEALALLEQNGGRTAMIGYLYLTLFEVSYAWNRLEEASDSLQSLQRIAQDWHQVELLVLGEICAARLWLARGDLSPAQEALQKAEVLVEQEGFTNYARWVVPARVQCWLAQGNLAVASDWAAQTAFHPEAWNPMHKAEVLLLVRILLAQQQYLRAEETLSSFSRYFDQPGDLLRALEWMALSMVALHHTGKRAQAREVATRLLALTEPEGLLRVYLDQGGPMKQALLALLTPACEQASRSPKLSHSYIANLLAAFEQEEQHERTSALAESLIAPAPVLSGKRSRASAAPLEPLTRREQEILRLLSDGASNQEIADALVIELSTVKKHVSNLLGKLGAESRTQAIAQARARSLL